MAIPAKVEAPGFTATLWYPAESGSETRFGVGRIRPGYLAVAEGMPRLAPAAPLIVLSHGTGGSAQSLAWLATSLARHGALVVAADHPTSSGGDPERASMMLMAGARLDFARFPAFCKSYDDGACRAFARYFEDVDSGFYTRSNADLSEPRLRAAVAIAPGFTEAFTAESLRAMPTPLLLITGERDQQLPPPTHVHPMQHLLPTNSGYREIGGAQHFSFLPLCGDDAIALLAESNEEFVCQVFGDKSRPEIHAERLQAITTFLGEHNVWPVFGGGEPRH
jgi:predicted dienelactone hydrolase